MPIPKTKEFENFLGSLALCRPATELGWASVTLTKEQAFLADNDKVTTYPALHLWYRTDSGLSPVAFNRRVATELNARSHAASDSTINCITGFLAATSQTECDRLALLNEILDAVVECDVSHYVFLAPSTESTTLAWQGFTFGCIDFDKFSYRCQKVGWENELRKVSAKLRNCGGIESPIYHTKTIAWPALLKRIASETNAEVMIQLYDSYFKACSEHDIEIMWRQLDEGQHLFSIFDCNWVDVKMIRRSPIAKCVSIHMRHASPPLFGNVTFRTGIYTTRFCPEDKTRFDHAQAIQNNFNLGSFSQSEIHQTIKSCLRFTHRAKQHERDGQLSEAFLHLVIALEILFSETKATTDAVSSRVAVIVHRKLGLNYKPMCKAMARLYDLRSKYVHRGILISEEHFKELHSIILAILECLLRLQARPESHAEGFMSSWLKRVDWIGASLEANLVVDSKTLSEHGIE